METKTGEVSIKQTGEGKATVVIATLGVKDKDGDVLLPGAFGEQVVPVVGAHDWKMPPIGKARIREVGQEAVADIEFNDTSEGKNWYQALKFDWEHPPARQQYSWGFQVPPTHTHRGKHGNDEVRFLHGDEKGQPLPIWEVSPVLVGAGQGTRSLSVKAFDDLPEPETAEGEWDDLKATGVRVQSLIFPKSKWDSADAVRSWLSSHDYSTSLDATGSSWRARQESPDRFTRLRSFCINPSRSASSEECRVMAVGGPMKESRGMAQDTSEQLPSDGGTLWHVVGVHHTGLDDSPFEAIRQYKRVQSSQAAGLYRSAFAIQWPGTNPEMKESWGLLHHVIDDDGKPGAASLQACLLGMSLLKGWDGVFIPESIREELHAHYAAHLHDGGVDVPELMKRDSGIEIKHELRFWLWLAKSVIDRRERVQEFLIRVGKDESKELVDQFDQLFRYVTHMHGVAGSAGEAMTHLAEQEELSQRAQQITQELAEEALREEEAKQAEIKELFERFRANHG